DVAGIWNFQRPLKVLVPGLLRRGSTRVLEKSVHLPEEARFRQDRRTKWRGQGGAIPAAALRDSETRRDPAALRPSAGVRRRVQVMGGDARPLARSARQTAGGRGGGSPAGLW